MLVGFFPGSELLGFPIWAIIRPRSYVIGHCCLYLNYCIFNFNGFFNIFYEFFPSNFYCLDFIYILIFIYSKIKILVKRISFDKKYMYKKVKIQILKSIKF